MATMLYYAKTILAAMGIICIMVRFADMALDDAPRTTCAPALPLACAPCGLTAARRIMPRDTAVAPRQNAQRRHLRVISFSIFRPPTVLPKKFPDYGNGLLYNVLLAVQVFEGWQIRIYLNEGALEERVVAALRALAPGVQLEWRVVDEQFMYEGMFWRFNVADDPDVERFIVRDLDSRLSWRDRVAVDAWIGSGKDFHLMRDHVRYHESFIVLGGMWGAVGGFVPNMSHLLESYTKRQLYGHDQDFLRDIIWPRVFNRVHSTVANTESFTCQIWKSVSPCTGFTTSMSPHFVGEAFDSARTFDCDAVGVCRLVSRIADPWAYFVSKNLRHVALQSF